MAALLSCEVCPLSLQKGIKFRNRKVQLLVPYRVNQPLADQLRTDRRNLVYMLVHVFSNIADRTWQFPAVNHGIQKFLFPLCRSLIAYLKEPLVQLLNELTL